MSAVERLATWPTPVEPLAHLGPALGLGSRDLWIKRDDLVGLGGGGGNKVRKLERTMADLLGRGVDLVVTSGAAQSNHARLTAAAGARFGVPVLLVLKGQAPGAETGNLLLDHLLGARLAWAGDDDLDAAVQRQVHEAEAEGLRVGVIPFGGSNASGASAYAEAGEELLQQLPDLRRVVVAVGSGGTMAGLVRALGPDRVLGVDVGAVPDAIDRVHRLWTELGGGAETDQQRLHVRGDLVGEGYGIFTTWSREALQLMARSEGIVLDPVHTGRAAAGLFRSVREGRIQPGEQTVLLHSGGLPGLFGHPEAAPWKDA